MSRGHAITSAFIAVHLAAITLGAIPPPDALPSLKAPLSHRPTPLSQTLIPVLDGVVHAFDRVHRALWPVVRPLNNVTAVYLSGVGLSQRWGMFSIPPKTDEYVRLRYYVASGSDRVASWTSTELLLPAHPEDRVRLVQSYRDSFRDKAFDVMLGEFREHREVKGFGPDTRSDDLPDDLQPFARYFTRRFATRYLLPTERVVRTEVWKGTAPNPPPGATPVTGTPAARLENLSAYFGSPLDDRTPNPPLPPYHAIDRELDISWVLEYYERYE
jgi:hypothetical protein